MKVKYITPAVTIFTENGGIDAEGNKKIYNRIIDGGVDGIVVMGSTGEFFAMTIEQIKELIDISTSCCAGRTELYIGTSRMIAEETIELGNYAIEKGANGVMIISPYYFQLPDESIERYYDIVAEGIKGDIFLYNYPDITGHSISAQTVLNLVKKHKNIVGIKDTVPMVSHIRSIINTVRPQFPDFQVYGGFDDTFPFVAHAGGNGCIGGLSNIMPEVFSKWAEAANNGDYAEVSRISQKVNIAMEICGVSSPYIPAVKRALNILGVEISEYVKPPFTTLNSVQEKKLKDIMSRIGLI